MIRVLIAEDQTLIRAALAALLAAEPDIQVVGEVGDGEQAVAAVRHCAPDVVVMDVRMPVMDGVEAVRRILGKGSAARSDPAAGPASDPASDPVPAVLMLTNFHVDAAVRAALQAGASGFLLKDAVPEDLIRAVRAVAAGDAWLDPAVARGVIDEFSRTPGPPVRDAQELAVLTARERQTLALVAQGLSNAEIADVLYIGMGTVKTHVGHILTKLDLRDRAQAIALAHRYRLTGPVAHRLRDNADTGPKGTPAGRRRPLG